MVGRLGMQYLKVVSSLLMAVAVALSTWDRLSNRFRWRQLVGTQGEVRGLSIWGTFIDGGLSGRL